MLSSLCLGTPSRCARNHLTLQHTHLGHTTSGLTVLPWLPAAVLSLGRSRQQEIGLSPTPALLTLEGWLTVGVVFVTCCIHDSEQAGQVGLWRMCTLTHLPGACSPTCWQSPLTGTEEFKEEHCFLLFTTLLSMMLQKGLYYSSSWGKKNKNCILTYVCMKPSSTVVAWI